MQATLFIKEKNSSVRTYTETGNYLSRQLINKIQRLQSYLFDFSCPFFLVDYLVAKLPGIKLDFPVMRDGDDQLTVGEK